MQGSFKIASPAYVNRVVEPYGYNSDIIKHLNAQFPAAFANVKDTRFSGSNELEKARAIYNYLRAKVRYKIDPQGKQVIQLPSRMLLDTKEGDCKSLGLAAAAFLAANGFKNVRLRYAGYRKGEKVPTHVYSVAADSYGNDIIVDPVYNRFNAEQPAQYKIDYPMQISVISGLATAGRTAIPVVNTNGALVRPVRKEKSYQERLEAMLTKVRPGGWFHNLVNNELLRVTGKTAGVTYPAEQLRRYASRLMLVRARAVRRPLVTKIIDSELAAIRSGAFSGALYSEKNGGAAIRGFEEEIGKIRLKKLLKNISPKKIFSFVKKTSFLPMRKAFLALVHLNVRGLAKRMSKLNDNELSSLWVKKFGGKLSVIKKAIEKGKKKKPLFGASKRVKAIKGIGYVVDDSNDGTIGAAPAIAAFLAAATPLILAFTKMLKGKGVPETDEEISAAANEAGESPGFSDVSGDGSTSGLSSWLKTASSVAQATGIIPDKPESPSESLVNSAIPGDDYTGDPTEKGEPAPGAGDNGSGFSVSPLLLIGAGTVAYFALK